MPRAVLAVCVAVLAAASAACSDAPKCTRPACLQVAPDADPASIWDVENVFYINTDQFVEARLLMNTGDKVMIDFSSEPGPAPWNVHSHDDDVVVYHEVGRHQAHQLEFVAPKDGDFFATWLNDGSNEVSVVIRLQLEGSTRFVEWL